VTNRTSRLPLLILALTLVVVFHRLLVGEAFFWGLPSLQFYPWREYAFDLLRGGQLPLWNPYNGAGAPLLANYQSALLYPLNWPGFVLPLAWAMSVTAVLHLFIAGWGMWRFTGRLGVPTLGQGISAFAFGLTGYLVARLGTYPTISAAAWIPWLLWAALGVLTDFRRRDVGWLALFAALQLLAGHAQTTWYSMLLVGAFSAWWTVTRRPLLWRRLLVVIAGMMLGAGIAAAQLLPTGELLAQSQRSGGVDYDFAMNFSYSFPRTLNFLSPNVFGTPADGTYVAKGAYFEDAVYIGLIPLLSALAAMISWLASKLRRAERPAYFATIPFWLLVMVIGFVFALGENSPVFPFLYRNIPTFSLFQAPVRWHIWTVSAMSVLAGIGVGAWGHGYWLFFGTRLATAACIGAALLALVAPRFLPPDVIDNSGVQAIIRAVVVTGILGALVGALTLTQPESAVSRRYGLWAMTVWVVIAADLAYAAWGLNPTISASFYDRREPVESFARAYWPEAAEEAVTFQRFLPFDDYRVVVNEAEAYRTSGLANLNLIDRAALLNNFDPLRIGAFNQYIDLIEANPEQRDTLLQAAGVDAAYNLNGDLETLEQPATRAWFAAVVCDVPDLLNPDWQPSEGVILNPVPDDCSPGSPDGEVLSIEDKANTLTVNVQVEADGWLVLADSFYPGWSVTLDGVPGEIHQANTAFRAVSVPAGTQMVRFEYHPWWLWPGLLISLVSLVLLLVLFRTKSPS
jgi:hypothetical protein